MIFVSFYFILFFYFSCSYFGALINGTKLVIFWHKESNNLINPKDLTPPLPLNRNSNYRLPNDAVARLAAAAAAGGVESTFLYRKLRASGHAPRAVEVGRRWWLWPFV